jgi:hypothetical protein
MKHIRLILVSIIACGAAVIVADKPFDAGTWPLPAPQLSIRIPFKLRLPGEYFIEVSMPRASADKIHVVDETLPCNLSYTIEKDGVPGQPHQITSVSSSGEYGWANVVLYGVDAPFRLSRGDYVISIYGGTGCAAASARGATVAVTEAVQHPTEQYLLSSLLRSLALLAVFGGLSVLAVIEVRSRPIFGSSGRSSGT